VRLDADELPLATARDDAAPVEAMRRLPAGRHTLAIDGKPRNLLVRAIPTMIYNVHKASTRIVPFGPHTWERISKAILPQCNIIESGGEYPAEMAAWRAAGKLWLTHVQTPGLLDHTFAVTVDQATECWKTNLGYASRLTDGMQGDEFISGYRKKAFTAFAQSLARLSEDPGFAGRIFIPFVVRTYDLPGGDLFLKTVLAAGWPFSIERYVPEGRTEADGKERIRHGLLERCRAWERALPGRLRRAVVTLMYASLPYCTANTCPTANFKVHLDMQMAKLAGEPLFFGLYGVQPYRSNYVDPETLRWMGKLLRHYCIEGRVDLLSQDPYELKHVRDPDFEEGAAHWQVSPAAPDSVSARTFAGYGALQGRYPPSPLGDTFLVLKRSAGNPNVVSQQLSDLAPGRQYSLKLITADYADLAAGRSRKAASAVSVHVENVDMLGQAFQHPYPNVRGPAAFGPKNRFWMNYHWRRFRARDASARLVITDWETEQAPGGPTGQETMISFVELQPFDEE